MEPDPPVEESDLDDEPSNAGEGGDLRELIDSDDVGSSTSDSDKSARTEWNFETEK